MYLELFKLAELPFRLSPDPQFLYLSKAHARAKAYMESTVWFSDGFVGITGEIGSGKTTLIETFIRELSPDILLPQINQTQLSTVEFLQSLLVQFGFTPFRMKKAELLATLTQFLAEQFSSGRKVVLIIDEAQNLSARVLEEIRLLAGVDSSKEKVLRIILAGQPELAAKLDAPQLSQRIRLRFHLTALNADDTRAYILHRLDIAGSQGREIFRPETIAIIQRYTGGVPRLINSLCDTAMLAAFNAGRDHVKGEDIMAAVAELQWREYSQRQVIPTVGTATGMVSSSLGAEANGEAPPLARLVVSSGGRTVTECLLRPGRLIIGRTPGNDLQIDTRFVSRHHCQILTTEQFCVLEDLNSTNGVFIKAKRVRRHNLNDGDVVTLGQHELIYIDDRPGRRNPEDPGSTDSHPVLKAIEPEPESTPDPAPDQDPEPNTDN
jgi:type II secretory pathway predicted ATPase ExeA